MCRPILQTADKIDIDGYNYCKLTLSCADYKRQHILDTSKFLSALIDAEEFERCNSSVTRRQHPPPLTHKERWRTQTSAVPPGRDFCAARGRGWRGDAGWRRGRGGCRTWQKPAPASGSSWPSVMAWAASWTAWSARGYPPPPWTLPGTQVNFAQLIWCWRLIRKGVQRGLQRKQRCRHPARQCLESKWKNKTIFEGKLHNLAFLPQE